ncbi:retrotransposon protein, partial [Tanacetum coccineum]
MYLRCFTSDKLKKWLDWLPWAQFCYNTSFHSFLKCTPFEVVYGHSPPRMISYAPHSSKLAAVDLALRDRDDTLRYRLLKAQSHMKTIYDSKHLNLEFSVGDMMLLKLQPYCQLSLRDRSNKK